MCYITLAMLLRYLLLLLFCGVAITAGLLLRPDSVAHLKCWLPNGQLAYDGAAYGLQLDTQTAVIRFKDDDGDALVLAGMQCAVSPPQRS